MPSGFVRRRVWPTATRGYLEFTHLVGLPHIHVADQFIGFAGAESGGQVSVYLQDSIQAGSRVTADLGLRVDRYDLLASAMHASPRVNLAVRVADATVIHASYNHFFVPPPDRGRSFERRGLTRFIEEIGVPLSPLVPIVEEQFEGGVTTRLGPVQLGVTSYWRETDNPGAHDDLAGLAHLFVCELRSRAGLRARGESRRWLVS